MAERVDEKILDFINEAEKAEARRDIKNGPIKIVDRYYEFEEKDFFDEKLKLFIPKDFEDMPEEISDLKYSAQNKPDIIKCNENGSVYFALKIIDKPLEENKVEELKNEMKEAIKNTNPINVFYEDGVLEVDSKNVGFLEFKSYGADGPLCSLMFFLEFEGEILMGTFSCPYEEYGEWREIVFHVINTIQIIKGEKGDEN
ncbi:hypothetical protein B0P06_001726 [Clostridium saccharoperbutylacetonicum]|uniref:Uncharacterized protein n=1 Tax=Clostridium saccharoperbutylacetonicum N1-4(HMT) TaxID=931276 RepID=M1LN37_9CLOT|nr:hypothetical protein [Clostridium saccharoperbutylacetonicum]AGF54210.1 hypothetical protein Cspa_c03920 [Clostridium saccharoperbutylacetonicum N1-4(HMT)]NRT59276.1 hypothetical protein [Clostridium saccharoperbutylacetonicum]NSB28466.1 hypothetical protein [Clostridium saccharoperbutylacetonicum]NSB41955.1 hypothetical protein [Clostridium saccharoperbutylacetonicum]